MYMKPLVRSLSLFVAALALATPARAQSSPRWFDSRTGHYFEARAFFARWTDCFRLAQVNTLFGRPGYLATIKDATEQAIVQDIVYAGYVESGIRSMWIGGFKTYHLEGRWQWVTGQAFNYARWGPLEPNNYGGVEHFLEMFADGYWNDSPDITTSDEGYAIIEWEPSPVVISSITGPTSVNSPAKVTYTFTLSAPAPPEGAILFLGTTLAAFSNLPKSVAFDPGVQARSVTFNVLQATSSRTGTISGYGKSKKSLSVTVTP